MASAKVLEAKKAVINEIEELVKNSESVVVFSYQGLTVSALNKLRRELKDVDGELKIYKNTLVKRALDDLKIDLGDFLEGPNAFMFGRELLEPIKVLSKFAKENDKSRYYQWFTC